jgi:hypothetical protein
MDINFLAKKNGARKPKLAQIFDLKTKGDATAAAEKKMPKSDKSKGKKKLKK